MKKIILRLLFLGIVIFAIYNLISLFTADETTVIAQLETMEKGYKLDGIIIRDEKLITFNSKNDGILDVSVAENEMVRKGKHVATYFDSDIDEETRAELAKINESISKLSSATDKTIAEAMSQKEIENEIESKAREIAYASPGRNLSVVSSLKSDINNLLEAQKNDDSEKLTVAELFQQFEKNPPADMAPCAKLWEIFNTFFLQTHKIINLKSTI